MNTTAIPATDIEIGDRISTKFGTVTVTSVNIRTLRGEQVVALWFAENPNPIRYAATQVVGVTR